jgi:hypothetical protein
MLEEGAERIAEPLRELRIPLRSAERLKRVEEGGVPRELGGLVRPVREPPVVHLRLHLDGVGIAGILGARQLEHEREGLLRPLLLPHAFAVLDQWHTSHAACEHGK